MSKKPLPPIPLLNSLFEIVGSDLVWRIDRPRSKAGSMAGSMKANGYWYVSIGNSLYLAHRIAFAIYNGFDPGDRLVDHKDRITTSNSGENLRLAGDTENTRNRAGATRLNSSSGVRNIEKRGESYRVVMQFGGRHCRFGSYKTLEQAVSVARAKRQELFGEFSGGDGYPSNDLSQGVTRAC